MCLLKIGFIGLSNGLLKVSLFRESWKTNIICTINPYLSKYLGANEPASHERYERGHVASPAAFDNRHVIERHKWGRIKGFAATQ